MDFKEIFTQKRVFFLLLFLVLVVISMNINFSRVIGAENQFFTLYQFLGPIAGGFLGPVFGVVSVALAQLADFFIVGKEWSIINMLRFLPMLFAVYYFARRKQAVSIIIPIICIILFVIHPVGRVAWLYSLFWLIPILGSILPKKVPGSLFFRSYGATFTAHAVGSVLWLYTVPMNAEQWLTLIPITAYERFLFGLGIAGSYVLFNTALDFIVDKWKMEIPTRILFLDKRYTLTRFFN